MLFISGLSFLCEEVEERLDRICHHMVSIATETLHLYVSKFIYLYYLERVEEELDSILLDEGSKSLFKNCPFQGRFVFLRLRGSGLWRSL